MNRRPSYASVAGGSTASPGNQDPSHRAGSFAHLMNPAPQRSEEEERTASHNTTAAASNNTWPTMQSSWGKTNSNVANYWSHLPSSSNDPMSSYQGDTRLIRPSHLRRTRYMEKLETQHKVKLAALRESGETIQQHQLKGGSLSKSSSSVSLHKLAPSHRGMTYEIVEHAPPIEEDAIQPLPSVWKEHVKGGGLEISSDSMELRCTSAMKQSEHDAAAARTDFPMPPQCGVYYYEVSILNKNKDG
jgi:hypothetical protein